MPDIAYTFGKLPSEQQPSAGGKGGTLSRLYQSGYPVPDGFVILPSAFTGNEISPETWPQLQPCLEYLRSRDPNTAFAVRSSAVAEDSALASFAGAFETVLNVHSDEEIKTAINTVYQSRQNERVKAYSQAQGVPVVDEMAVIVQRLVKADISGVIFTADPVTGSRARMVGNFVHGLGDKLVSGDVESLNFSIERPKCRYNGPSELKRFARRLYKLASRLEKNLGCPQDIEWATSRDKVYILQSRPITTMIGFNPITGEFNDSLTGDFTWSCVNVGEAMPDVMTPFTWSGSLYCWDKVNIVPGYEMMGNIGGRVYQNSTVMLTIMKALRQDIKSIVKEMGGSREEYTGELDRILTPLPGVSFFSILPGAIRMFLKMQAARKNLEGFIKGNPDWCRTQCQRVKAIQDREELASLYTHEYQARVVEMFWKVYATAFHYAELAGKLRGKLVEMVGTDDADILLSNTSRDDELLPSLGPLVGLSKLVRGEISRDEYLEQWGHRGPLEAELAVPRPLEDPDWLDKQLESFTKSSVNVEAMLTEQRARFDAAWERLRARYPRWAAKLRQRLEKVAEANRIREAVRSEFTRIILVARTWALRAGDLTEIGDDVFFLNIEEIIDLLHGTDTATAYIPARLRMYERYKALPPYPLLIRGRFDPFQWAADPDRSQHIFDASGLLQKTKLAAPSENVILGMAGSAGQAEGMVRRLDTPDDWDRLLPGEILVTSQTNIGWTLLFPKAKGIVTDIGAPLSHAAIVARELGIPAVVNCGDATTRLHTGDRVRVDGTQGTVEILETAT
jgi:phosphohistidine swiveling domain-containing protein